MKSFAPHLCSILVSGHLLACTPLLASEPEAPLQETTRELQALKSSKNSVGVSNGQPKIEMPQLLITPEGPAPTQNPLDARRNGKDLTGAKNRSQNWLVEGVAELERKDQPTSAAKRESDKLEELMPAGRDQAAKDGEAPSLLKLYDEQQEKAEAKRELVETAKPAVNPLAPFLQNWMGDSPVRGQFFDQFSRGNGGVGGPREEGTVAGNAVQSTEVVSNTPAMTAPGVPAREAATNPYLANLTPNGGRPQVENILNQTTPAFNQGNFLNNGIPAGAPPPPPTMQAPEARKKSMPTSVADEQKYFPQLKKF